MTDDFEALVQALTLGGKIKAPSLQSLFIRLYFGETHLASATAFLVSVADRPFLVTARHNVTGRDQNTGSCLDTTHAGIPDRLEIHHNTLSPLEPTTRTTPLYDEQGNPAWIEHPTFGGLCDVVILPVEAEPALAFHVYGRGVRYPPIPLEIAEQVSVIGFPMGHSAGGNLPIWCTGYIASEPSQDYACQPKFLIDCRTRKGQSGSPVIAFRRGMYAVEGGMAFPGTSNESYRPIGVYTGRIHPETDIGVVWRWNVVEELMDLAQLTAR